MSPSRGGTRAATGFVVDACVTMKLFIREPLTDKARLLFDSLKTEPPTPFHVPGLFYGECANVLWKHVRVFGYRPDKAEAHMDELLKLSLESHPTAGLVAGALRIAVAHDITAYDACYVALSERLGLPLVTADKRLVRKLEGTAYDVRWLGDMPLDAEQ